MWVQVEKGWQGVIKPSCTSACATMGVLFVFYNTLRNFIVIVWQSKTWWQQIQQEINIHCYNEILTAFLNLTKDCCINCEISRAAVSISLVNRTSSQSIDL